MKKRLKKSIAILIVMSLFSLWGAVGVFAEIAESSLAYNYYLPFFVADTSGWSGIGISNDSTTQAPIFMLLLMTTVEIL